jgi:hypothetical protein
VSDHAFCLPIPLFRAFGFNQSLLGHAALQLPFIALAYFTGSAWFMILYPLASPALLYSPA